MYKVKQRSLEAYPVQDMYTRFIEGSNKERREIYVQGYNQGVHDVLDAIEDIIKEYNNPEHIGFYNCILDKIKS